MGALFCTFWCGRCAIPVLGTSDLLGAYAGRGRRGIFLFPGVFFRALPSAFSELTGGLGMPAYERGAGGDERGL